MLTGTLWPAPDGARGLDTDTVLTAETAVALKEQGYSFAIRYLSLVSPQQPGDLSIDEGMAILGAGLALGSVQHVREAGWSPSGALGAADGFSAMVNAQEIGFPQGVSVGLDLEGVSEGATTQQVIDYCSAWHEAVQGAGYVPLLYVGSNCGLDGQEIYYALKFTRYWKSASDVPALPNRGYCLAQSLVPEPVADIAIDGDEAQTDLLGGTVIWLAMTPKPVPTA